MVEAQNVAMAGAPSAGAASQLEWTAQLVSSVEKRLRAAVSADELRKLTIENAKPEFKKVLQ